MRARSAGGLPLSGQLKGSTTLKRWETPGGSLIGSGAKLGGTEATKPKPSVPRDSPALVSGDLSPPVLEAGGRHAGHSSSGRGRGRGGAPLPANHLPVPVHRDVGPGLVVIRSKVAVGGSKPLIKSVLQGVELGPVTQMPGNRNPGHFRDPAWGHSEVLSSNRSATFTKFLVRRAPSSTEYGLCLGTAGTKDQGLTRGGCWHCPPTLQSVWAQPRAAGMAAAGVPAP